MSDAPPQEESQKKSPKMLILSIFIIIAIFIGIFALLIVFRESIFGTGGEAGVGAPTTGEAAELKNSEDKSNETRSDENKSSLKSKASVKEKSSMNLLQQGAEKEITSSGLGEKRRRSDLKEMGQAKNDLLINMGSIH